MSKPYQRNPAETRQADSTPEMASPDGWQSGMAGLLGIGFALILLKLVTPVVIPSLFDKPANVTEMLMWPWPITWGFGMLAVFAAIAVLLMRFQLPKPAWVFWMPLVWLGWQFIAGLKSVDPELSARTSRHFTGVVICFYLGWMVLGRLSRQKLFWWAMVWGFGIMLFSGFQQQYGELEQTKNYVEENERTHWQKVPLEDQKKLFQQGVLVITADGLQASSEFLKRVRNGRVYATFAGYPNALAGAILLLLPAMMVKLWQFSLVWPEFGRKVSLGLFAYMAMACLVWSGSKSGWLIMLVMGGVALWQLPFPKVWRQGVIAGLVVLGATGFALKYANYFKRGATSVGARMDYWQVGLRTSMNQPVFGTGPGTFGRIYKVQKRPESEMAQLAHNDYLEQACDSGFVGIVSYCAMLPLGLVLLYRKSKKSTDPLLFAVWLGLSGWAMQGFTEFSLYIPALSWVAFLMLGWLWASAGNGNEIDKSVADG